MKRFTVLDSFRGICALCVVLHHFNITGSITEWPLFRNATYMVEFFFVLSGFVLTHAYSKTEFHFSNLRAFAINRTFRIFPLHLMMLLVFIILECAKYVAQSNGIAFNKPAFSGVNAPDQIIPNLFLLQAWLPSKEILSFNYPSWSISVEYYLYAVFAVVLFSLYKRKNVLTSAFFAISFFAFCGLALPVFPSIKSEALYGIACFFGGSVTYFIYEVYKPKECNKLLFTLMEVATLLLCYYSVTQQYGYKSIITSFSFFLTIYVFSFEMGWGSFILRKSIFEYLGKISFSVYMTHAAVIFISISLAMACEKIFGLRFTYSVFTKSESTLRYMDFGSWFYNNFIVMIIIAIVITVSHFTYKIIEVKSISAGKRIMKKEEVINNKI
ncbi:acyltransferase [Serratia marcescens]|uniref:acyltransferase family protein n=1 Tax=Serratia marcescens TaxID=615 RepID=UPI0029EBC3C0|nr:acyltransferase [Serratia marcescens]